jgi:hypothetical protein
MAFNEAKLSTSSHYPSKPLEADKVDDLSAATKHFCAFINTSAGANNCELHLTKINLKLNIFVTIELIS